MSLKNSITCIYLLALFVLSRDKILERVKSIHVRRVRDGLWLLVTHLTHIDGSSSESKRAEDQNDDTEPIGWESKVPLANSVPLTRVNYHLVSAMVPHEQLPCSQRTRA